MHGIHDRRVDARATVSRSLHRLTRVAAGAIELYAQLDEIGGRSLTAACSPSPKRSSSAAVNARTPHETLACAACSLTPRQRATFAVRALLRQLAFRRLIATEFSRR